MPYRRKSSGWSVIKISYYATFFSIVFAFVATIISTIGNVIISSPQITVARGALITYIGAYILSVALWSTLLGPLLHSYGSKPHDDLMQYLENKNPIVGYPILFAFITILIVLSNITGVKAMQACGCLGQDVRAGYIAGSGAAGGFLVFGSFLFAAHVWERLFPRDREAEFRRVLALRELARNLDWAV